MKVLFIDDEPLIRKGLQVIIPWKDYGFTEFFEAEDGLEGLRLIESENPDLVLLDIHMENMSGLSVAKQTRENEFSGRIIILSGYSDFEYAKSAIDYGVTSYLLKPVDPEQLIEAVQKSLDELHKERLVSIYSDQPAHLAKNSILSGILLGNLSYTAEMETVYHLSLNSRYYRLALLFTTENAKENSTLPEFPTQVEKKHLTVSMSDLLTVLILTSPSEEQVLKKQLQAYWESTPSSSSLMAIISTKTDSHAGLSALYNDTLTYQQEIYYYKNRQSNLLLADSISQAASTRQTDFNLISFTENLLCQVLLLQNTEVENSMIALRDYFIQRKPPRDSIGFILLNCYIQVTSKLFEQHPKLEFEIADKEKFTAHLYADCFLCDSIAYLNSQMQKAIAFIKDSEQSSTCQRICQYIDTNLASPLKLESIAALFGYNSAYLGKLFARETGEHFNTYLDRKRIELAKEYLEKGATVAQTCELSGFTNTDYFTKKFKKYVGTLPSEYKKQNS